MQTLNGRRVHQAVSIALASQHHITEVFFFLGNPRQLGLPIQHLQ